MNIFIIKLALKIINKIKTFILHSLKFAAVCVQPLTAAVRKLSSAVINFSTVSDNLFLQQNSEIESIHSGASKTVNRHRRQISLDTILFILEAANCRWLWVRLASMRFIFPSSVSLLPPAFSILMHNVVFNSVSWHLISLNKLKLMLLWAVQHCYDVWCCPNVGVINVGQPSDMPAQHWFNVSYLRGYPFN